MNPSPLDDPPGGGPGTSEDLILRQLVVTYCSVRQVPAIDVDADLVTLGLQSIDAIRMANLVADTFGVELALDQLLRHPTLRAAARQIARDLVAATGDEGPPAAVDWEEFTL